MRGWIGSSWRHLEGEDGAGAGAPGSGGAGASDGAPASAGQPPAPAAPLPDLGDARFAALAQYPQADVDLLRTATSPEQVNQIAQRTHEAAQALAQARQGASGGAPVPAANAAAAAEGEDARRLRELQYKVRQRMRPGFRGGRTVLEPFEAEEARDLFFKATWNGHMGHRRAGRGNVSDPPTGAPAAVAVPALPAPGRAF